MKLKTAALILSLLLPASSLWAAATNELSPLSLDQIKEQPAPEQPQAQEATATDLAHMVELANEKAIAKVKPAVVEIFVQMMGGTAIGSGYIINPEGLLVTNAHVAGPAGVGGTVEIHLSNGQKVPGLVVAVNTDKDIALVQLPKLANGTAWPSIAISDSDDLVVGETVFAIGAPLALAFTATHGIISSVDKDRGSINVNWGQTDAPINHGNSGGPLFNLDGELVGMNTAIASPKDAGSIGLGFFIMSNDIKAVLAQYKATGNINSAWLGIIIDAQRATMPRIGVVIDAVRPGSPAAAAGLKARDTIVAIDGEPLPEGGQNALMVLAKIQAVGAPGDKHVFRVDRNGAQIIVTVVFGDKQPPKAHP